MKVEIKLKIARAKVLVNKAKEEGKKLAVAVVIAESVLVGGYAIGEDRGVWDMFRGETITIVSPVQAKEPAKEEIKEIDEIARIAEYIWNKESTRGKHNFSKCEAIGKINGIGYGIPGNGEYMCFDSHADEMRALEGWIISKRAAGYTDENLLCLYNTGSPKPCAYAVEYR